MRFQGVATVAVLIAFILGVVGMQYWAAHPRVPPPLEAGDCTLAAPPGELPNAEFTRQGGRTTRAKVWHQGAALMVADVAQGRDVQRYDRLELEAAGPMTVVQQRSDPVLPQARSFLWERWRDRKPAYLILTLHSVDATSTSHVFIEEDDAGRWRVYWRIVRHHNEVDDLPTAYDVRWVIPGEWDKPGTPLPSGMAPDPVRHSLEFHDVCGTVDRSF